VSDDWKFLSKVVDRILLYIYITVCFVGGAAVMMSAPSLYDTSKPMVTGTDFQRDTPMNTASGSGAAADDCESCKFVVP